MRALLATVGFAVGVGLATAPAEAAGVPAFIRVNIACNELSTLDGKRTSPIANVERMDGRLMIQGLQNAGPAAPPPRSPSRPFGRSPRRRPTTPGWRHCGY